MIHLLIFNTLNDFFLFTEIKCAVRNGQELLVKHRIAGLLFEGKLTKKFMGRCRISL